MLSVLSERRGSSEVDWSWARSGGGQLLALFWPSRLRDKMIDAVEGGGPMAADDEREARSPRTGPDEPVGEPADAHPSAIGHRTQRFPPTDSAEAHEEKLRARKAEGQGPKKTKQALDAGVMGDCGEELGDLGLPPSGGLRWWEMEQSDFHARGITGRLREDRPTGRADHFLGIASGRAFLARVGEE
eukprot:5119040-Pyramimonas_sp.AAC.1